MSARIVVVTGTDTEIGKTFVTASIARALSDADVDVVAIKPVESGRPRETGPDEDGVMIAEASRQEAPRCALQRLRAPLAPPDAADLEETELRYDYWLDCIRNYAEGADVVLVEGAGGLLSPLTWSKDALALAVDLDADVLLVASDCLGTQNHTRLALRALNDAGLEVLGVVLSAPETSDASTGRNASALERVEKEHRFVAIPRCSSWREGAKELADLVDWFADE